MRGPSRLLRVSGATVAVLSVCLGWVNLARAELPAATPEPVASPAFSGGTEATIASIPLFARLGADGPSLRSYSVPIRIDVSLHKFIFSIPFRRDGTVDFEAPDKLKVTINKVQQQYADVFGELGTPRTWPLIYNLQVVRSDLIDGRLTYQLRGTPRQPSALDHVLIRMSDENAPIDAQWFLRSGWTITSAIELESVETFLLTKHAQISITGHGVRIRGDMTYGQYVLNGAISSPSDQEQLLFAVPVKPHFSIRATPT